MIKYIREQNNLDGKTVLLRTDLDVPHDGTVVSDDFRIRKSVATVQFLIEHGAKVIIVSKIGRPKCWSAVESLKPAADRLAELLGRTVVTADGQLPPYSAGQLVFYTGDIRKQESIDALRAAPVRDVILLENIRFYPEEENADTAFAQRLASLADLFVFDAFAMAHRSEASVSMVPRYLPSYAGLNVEQELTALGRIIRSAEHPSLVMIGGIKISDKVGAVQNLGKRVDSILVSGGPSNLFFYAKGYEIGESVCEKENVQMAKDIMRNFGDKLVLPLDCVVAAPDYSGIRVCKPTDIHKGELVYDIGPATILEFAGRIKQAKQMVWNGPVGLFEQSSFSHGSMSIATLFAARCQGFAFGVVGGGDTQNLLDRAQVTDMVDFVSTAGGAMLDYLAGETLPGLAALEKN